MDFIDLITLFIQDQFSISSHVIFIQGQDLPHLLLSWLSQEVKKSCKRQFIYSNLTTLEFEEFQLRLTCLFLGQAIVYWLSGFDELTADKKKRWELFLKKYQGPHTIILCMSSVYFEKSNHVLVTIPPLIDTNNFISLNKFFLTGKVKASHSSFIATITEQYPQLSWDSAYKLIFYIKLIGQFDRLFIKDWLPSLVKSNKSLFTLSQNFFAQKEKAFFVLWSTIVHEYNEHFWISFWSEQLWRAILYKFHMDMQQNEIAKKVSYRLPFSFLQHDWKRYSISFLKEMHQKIYELDFKAKNGANVFFGLELFYLTFFQEKFF